MAKRVSLEKAAAIHSGRAKCTDCPAYKSNNCCITICDYAFIKGFKSDYKYHKKIIKTRNND